MPDEVREFAALYPFGLDEYQIDGCRELGLGRGVLVAAPTGAGKTVVGEFAVHLARHQVPQVLLHHAHQGAVQPEVPRPGRPLRPGTGRAADRRHLRQLRGADRGDDHRGAAQHDLRGLPDARQPRLRGDGRGALPGRPVPRAVWEEVILGLADSVQIVALSATVSNVEDFGEWLRTVRGEFSVVVSERRPVPLFQHVLVGRRLLDLFDGVAPTAHGTARRADGQGQPRAAAGEQERGIPGARRLAAPPRPRGRGKTGQGQGSGQYGGATHPRFAGRPTSRGEVADRPGGRLPAARHLLHLLPGRLRRRGPAGPRRRDQAHQPRGGRRCSASIADRHVAGLSAAGPGGLGVTRRFRDALHGGCRGPPRGAAARVQGHRRGGLRDGGAQARLRDGDAGAGHQHARPHRRAGEAGQVQRREPRRHHAGGVHAADRPRGASRHRRRGPRRGAVAGGHGPPRRGRPRLAAHLSAALQLRAHLQHGRQPDGHAGARARPRPAQPVVRAVPDRQVRGDRRTRREARARPSCETREDAVRVPPAATS